MVQFRSTTARIVREEWLDRVPSPAYDSLTPAERRAFRVAHPESFLNVTRSPEDEPPGTETPQEELLRAGRQSLDHLLAAGAFAESPGEVLYLYQLSVEGQSQVGIVGEIPVDAYESGEVRIHEEVRQARADLLADHFDIVGAASSPVALAFRGSAAMTAVVERVTALPPALDFDDESGLRQTIWLIAEPADIAELQSILIDEPMYIIDGHHRAAAALTARDRNAPGSPLEGMLVAAFPDDDLHLLGFNRWIRGLDAVEAQALIGRVDGLLAVDALPELSLGVVALYSAGQWYRYELAPAAGLHFDAVEVRGQLLQPAFGIERSDDRRLVNLAGDQPIDGIVQTVDTLGGIAIVMAPIELDAFMAAADAGVVLPPKSTYFTPKVRSGIFLRLNH